jgi:hypothetical protein
MLGQEVKHEKNVYEQDELVARGEGGGVTGAAAAGRLQPLP